MFQPKQHTYTWILEYGNKIICNDIKFILEHDKGYNDILSFIGPKVKDDFEIIKLVLIKHWSNLLYIDNKFRNNRVLIELMRKSWDYSNGCISEFLNDEFVYRLVD